MATDRGWSDACSDGICTLSKSSVLCSIAVKILCRAICRVRSLILRSRVTDCWDSRSKSSSSSTVSMTGVNRYGDALSDGVVLARLTVLADVGLEALLTRLGV